jgi:hypothetical protein
MFKPTNQLPYAIPEFTLYGILTVKLDEFSGSPITKEWPIDYLYPMGIF